MVPVNAATLQRDKLEARDWPRVAFSKRFQDFAQLHSKVSILITMSMFYNEQFQNLTRGERKNFYFWEKISFGADKGHTYIFCLNVFQ